MATPKPTPKPMPPKGKDWTQAPSSIDFGKKFGEYQRKQAASNPLPVKKVVPPAKKNAVSKMVSKLKKNEIPASPTK